MAAPRPACEQARPWRQKEVALPSQYPPFLPNALHEIVRGDVPRTAIYKVAYTYALENTAFFTYHFWYFHYLLDVVPVGDLY